jgi:hypothetical protein
MQHARPDYNRIQDPALRDPSLLAPGSTPIGSEEPVFLIRGKDEIAPAAVRGYVSLLRASADELEDIEGIAESREASLRAATLRDMADVIERHASAMEAWQGVNGRKLPDMPVVQVDLPKLQKVTIYGASDDLIEVEGDFSEEYNPSNDDDPTYLAFGDGTVLSVKYGDATGGFWRINRVRVGTATYAKTEATDEDDDYSDRVTLEGDLRWVVVGTQLDKIGK